MILSSQISDKNFDDLKPSMWKELSARWDGKWKDGKWQKNGQKRSKVTKNDLKRSKTYDQKWPKNLSENLSEIQVRLNFSQFIKKI